VNVASNVPILTSPQGGRITIHDKLKKKELGTGLLDSVLFSVIGVTNDNGGMMFMRAYRKSLVVFRP
jgi:hypothetical protein